MPPDADPNELVYIKNKNSQVKGFGGPVTRQSVIDVWSHKGWEEATPAEVAKAEAKALADTLAGTDAASAGEKR